MACQNQVTTPGSSLRLVHHLGTRTSPRMEIVVDDNYYSQILYPFQDLVLDQVNVLTSPFYLTGGTALSRGYFNHRFSDDLDFFVDDNPLFTLWSDRIISTLSKSVQWKTHIIQRDERFIRLSLIKNSVDLKIDMINDVPSRVGTPIHHPILGLLDTPENILANKITAVLDRSAPKDLADIWALCTKMNLSLTDAIQGAQSKASGVFPVDLARVLCSVTLKDWDVIKWTNPPDPEKFINDLNKLGNTLID
jgi:hypothetical protein